MRDGMVEVYKKTWTFKQIVVFYQRFQHLYTYPSCNQYLSWIRWGNIATYLQSRWVTKQSSGLAMYFFMFMFAKVRLHVWTLLLLMFGNIVLSNLICLTLSPMFFPTSVINCLHPMLKRCEHNRTWMFAWVRIVLAFDFMRCSEYVLPFRAPRHGNTRFATVANGYQSLSLVFIVSCDEPCFSSEKTKFCHGLPRSANCLQLFLHWF